MRNSAIQKESRIPHFKSFTQQYLQNKIKMTFQLNTYPSTFRTHEGSPFPDENRTPAHRKKCPANGHDESRPAGRPQGAASRNRKSAPRRTDASRECAASSGLRKKPDAHRFLRRNDVAGSPPTSGNRFSGHESARFVYLLKS